MTAIPQESSSSSEYHSTHLLSTPDSPKKIRLHFSYRSVPPGTHNSASKPPTPVVKAKTSRPNKTAKDDFQLRELRNQVKEMEKAMYQLRKEIDIFMKAAVSSSKPKASSSKAKVSSDKPEASSSRTIKL